MESRSVIVENIPVGATQEGLVEIFRECGEVVHLPLFFAVGETTGSAWCEFSKHGMALSAVRNLNGREYLGHTLGVRLKQDPGDAMKEPIQQNSTLGAQETISKDTSISDQIMALTHTQVAAMASDERIYILGFRDLVNSKKK